MQLMEEILTHLFSRRCGCTEPGGPHAKGREGGKDPAFESRARPDLSGFLEKLPAAVFDDAESLGHIQDYLSLSLSATQAKQRLKQLGYNASRFPTIRVSKVEERTHAFCVLVRNWANLAVGSRLPRFAAGSGRTRCGVRIYLVPRSASIGRKERRKQLLTDMKEMIRQKASLIVAFASAPAGGDIQPEDDAVEDILWVFGEVPSPT